MKPCVIVVTGSVVGCGRRNPEPMYRSYRGPRQLSQSCACKKGGRGGARISTWTGGPCPGRGSTASLEATGGGLVPRRLLGAEGVNGACCVCGVYVCSEGGVGGGRG